jgi:cytochrome c oxidase subunit 2
MMLATASDQGSFWMPAPASNYAEGVDWLFYVVFYVCVVMFVLILGLMGAFLIRYRHRTGHAPVKTATHGTALELTWTIIPTIVVMAIFYYGFRGYLDMATPPPYAYEIQVNAYKWGWDFQYPNGHIDQNLHVPLNRPVRLVLQSQDVIHSLFSPAFRIKKDCVPGRYNTAWFEPTQEGTFDLYCTEYCGTKHSEMLAKVVVQDESKFRAWLEEAANWAAKLPPAEAGAKLYQLRGCGQCHSVDGSGGIGPTFKNLYGSQHGMKDGSNVNVDENYVRESILYPAKRIVAGYENVMPTYQGRLKDSEITALIAYLKSISDKAPQETAPITGATEESEQGDP